MILYLAVHKGSYKHEVLFDLCRFLRGYRSGEEAACDLWKTGEDVSRGYELYEIDFEKVTIQRVSFPEVSFRCGSGKALKPKKGNQDQQKGTAEWAAKTITPMMRPRTTLEALKRTMERTRKIAREIRGSMKDKPSVKKKRV